MDKKLPTITLISTIFFLILAVITLIVGSNKSQVYNQMNKTVVIDSYKEIKRDKYSGFILTGLIKSTYQSTDKKSVDIELLDKSITIESGFTYSLGNMDRINQGARVTIFAAKNIVDNREQFVGYELYEGSPAQYINYLSSPYNAYMLYVRIFIALALIFFLFSIILNIKK